MTLFLLGLVILVIGYFVYGSLVERILGADPSKKTPAVQNGDGVDYVVLPRWKNMLIHLLNIAGIGPVIGVISGIKFGPIVFIIIPVGCLLMGAVNDFVAGMMSLRHNGANLTELVRIYFTKKGYYFFSVFVSITLLLVVAVFINVPANLIKTVSGGSASVFYISVVAIFVYYIIATLFPVDKIIGKAYPVFGLVLLVGTGFIFVSLMIRGFQNPDILQASEGFKAQMFTMANNHPILPLLFVNIACGILSGFHGTQAPIVARTMKNESEAKNTFFGMMVAEGFIAMVWAAGALVIYNKFPALMNDNPNSVLIRIAQEFVSGKYIGTIVVVSVIILAITSGDTALRSLRLSVAEQLNVSQKAIIKRIMIVVPLIVLVTLLLIWSNQNAKSFGFLWNYFAWANQMLAAFSLGIGTVYLVSQKKPCIITVLPGMFITAVVTCYILWISKEHGGPVGLGIGLTEAYIGSAFIAVLIYIAAYSHGLAMQKKNALITESPKQ